MFGFNVDIISMYNNKYIDILTMLSNALWEVKNPFTWSFLTINWMQLHGPESSGHYLADKPKKRWMTRKMLKCVFYGFKRRKGLQTASYH